MILPNTILNKVKQCCWHSRHAGQSAVELAMAVPLLALFLLGIADFSRLFFLSIAVNNAARAGVQYGAQNAADLDGMKRAAKKDYGVDGLTATPSEFCACPNGSAPPVQQSCTPTPTCTPQSDERDYVQMQTSATFNTLIDWPGIPSLTTVSANAVMREK